MVIESLLDLVKSEVLTQSNKKGIKKTLFYLAECLTALLYMADASIILNVAKIP